MSKKKLNNLIIIGETTDKKFVVDGVWKMFETHGLPMDIIFDLCIRNNSIPDWTKLYKQMVSSGMAHDRALSKLEESINDSFGKDFSEVVIFRLDQIFKVKPAESSPTTLPQE